jgi:hypothetical protein
MSATDTPNYLHCEKLERVHTIELPPAYWSDHDDRCTSLDDPIVEPGRRGNVKVTLSDRDLHELYNSAEHFATTDFGYDAQEWFGLKASARATMRRIETYWAAS